MLSILCIILGLELSYADGFQAMYEPPEYEGVEFSDTYYISFNTQIFLYEYVYTKGSVKIPVSAYMDNYFWPVALSSFFEVGVLLNGLSVGWRHFCTHPVAPYYTDKSFLKFYDESGGEFFIRFETERIKVF